VLDWSVWPIQLSIPLGFLSAAGTLFPLRGVAGAQAAAAGVPGMKALGLTGTVFGLLMLRQPLLVVLLAAAGCVHTFWGRGNLEDIIEDMWVGLDKEVILSIPLFILCGTVMTRGSIAQRLIRILSAMTRPLPGGMAVATILSCAVFAAISGSSIVTMLAIGTVMYPGHAPGRLRQQVLARRHHVGRHARHHHSPSIPMIIYGLVTETSVTDLFASGFGPGILLTIALSAYSIWFNRAMPTAAFDLAEFRIAFREGIWAAMMPVILLGGIYSGYFTATEAAAVALAYSLAVEIFVHRELKAGDFYNVVLETSKLGGSLFPLIAVALSLNIILTEHRVPQSLVNLMQGYISSPLMFMILVNLLLLVVGCLMTTGEAILVLAPLLAPLAESYGYNKVLFGLIMILNLEIGYLTPRWAST
jgi:C4-dicarboxylate transporter DctM subunit